jgi:hypothetical protein
VIPVFMSASNFRILLRMNQWRPRKPSRGFRRKQAMETQTRTNRSDLALTLHSRARMQQRGITARMVRIALEYGERRFSRDAVCHQLTERALCGTPFVSESDRLRGLCVVISRDGSIITVKWEYRFREPGPLRRANAENWRKVRPRRSLRSSDPAAGARALAA